jgi:hypothetical protein
METTTCAKCGVDLKTPAERFLHEKMHAEPVELGRYRNIGTIGNIPYVDLPTVARVMQEYADDSTPKVQPKHLPGCAYDHGKPHEETDSCVPDCPIGGLRTMGGLLRMILCNKISRPDGGWSVALSERQMQAIECAASSLA